MTTNSIAPRFPLGPIVAFWVSKCKNHRDFTRVLFSFFKNLLRSARAHGYSSSSSVFSLNHHFKLRSLPFLLLQLLLLSFVVNFMIIVTLCSAGDVEFRSCAVCSSLDDRWKLRSDCSFRLWSAHCGCEYTVASQDD